MGSDGDKKYMLIALLRFRDTLPLEYHLLRPEGYTVSEYRPTESRKGKDNEEGDTLCPRFYAYGHQKARFLGSNKS